MKLLDALKTFGEKALADIEIPLTTAHKLYLGSKVIIDQLPADKTVVLGLIDAVETFAGDVPADLAGDGLNLSADAKTVKDGLALVSYFRTTFLPAVETGFEALKIAVAAQPAPPAPQLVQLDPGGPLILAPAYIPPAAPLALVVQPGAPAPTATIAGAGSGAPIPGPGRHTVTAG